MGSVGAFGRTHPLVPVGSDDVALFDVNHLKVKGGSEVGVCKCPNRVKSAESQSSGAEAAHLRGGHADGRRARPERGRGALKPAARVWEQLERRREDAAPRPPRPPRRSTRMTENGTHSANGLSCCSTRSIPLQSRSGICAGSKRRVTATPRPQRRSPGTRTHL